MSGQAEGAVDKWAMIETAHGQWLVFDASTAASFDTVEEAADELTLRSGGELLDQNDPPDDA